MMVIMMTETKYLFTHITACEVKFHSVD